MSNVTTAATLTSADLTNKGETLRAFLRIDSARIVASFVAVLLVLRLVIGGWGRGDVIVAVITLLLVGVFEWVVHLFLLHAPEDSFRMTKLGTGTGHREHHLDPTHMGHLLLARNDAALFSVMFAGFTASWTLPLLWITGSVLLAPYVTAYLLAAIGLLHYEWTHLLVHTKYRPKSRYYKRLARNHRLHHFRNEHYWLGVTSNLGDRVLQTLPADKSDVPLSETARTLG